MESLGSALTLSPSIFVVVLFLKMVGEKMVREAVKNF